MDLPDQEHQGTEALTRPTRLAVLRCLVASCMPLRAENVSERLDIHVNSARSHLMALRDAGIAQDELVRTGGRGRPYRLWSVAAGAQPFGQDPSSYERLSRLLATALARALEGKEEAVEEVGYSEGLALAKALGDQESLTMRLAASMAALGFSPCNRRSGDRTEISFGNCSFGEAARSAPSVVCALHRAIVLGLVDGLGMGDRFEGFVVTPPGESPCRILLNEEADSGGDEAAPESCGDPDREPREGTGSQAGATSVPSSA